MSSAFLSARIAAESWARCSEVIGLLLVKSPPLDDRANRLWNQIADGEAARNPRADFRRRNIHAADDRREVVRRIVLAATEDDELHRAPKLVVAMPRLEFRHVVVSDEVKEARLRPARAEYALGLDRKARSVPMQIAIFALKARLARDRRRDHLAPRLAGSGCGVELVRGKRRGNEQHAIQPKLLPRFASEDEVPVVDGIEAAAVKADFHAVPKKHATPWMASGERPGGFGGKDLPRSDRRHSSDRVPMTPHSHHHARE